MFKNKKNIIIIIFSFIILLLLLYIVITYHNIIPNKLKNLLETGYQIRIFENDKTGYIVLKKDNVIIIKMYGKEIGDTVSYISYQNKSINDSDCILSSITYDSITSKDDKMIKQYSSAINWLKANNLSENDLSDILSIYYYNNKSKIENTENIKSFIK